MKRLSSSIRPEEILNYKFVYVFVTLEILSGFRAVLRVHE
jgi:hypothetical protein